MKTLEDKALAEKQSELLSKAFRSDYSKSSIRVDNVVMHYCDTSGILSNIRKFDIRHWTL